MTYLLLLFTARVWRPTETHVNLFNSFTLSTGTTTTTTLPYSTLPYPTLSCPLHPHHHPCLPLAGNHALVVEAEVSFSLCRGGNCWRE